MLLSIACTAVALAYPSRDIVVPESSRTFLDEPVLMQVECGGYVAEWERAKDGKPQIWS